MLIANCLSGEITNHFNELSPESFTWVIFISSRKKISNINFQCVSKVQAESPTACRGEAHFFGKIIVDRKNDSGSKVDTQDGHTYNSFISQKGAFLLLNQYDE